MPIPDWPRPFAVLYYNGMIGPDINKLQINTGAESARQPYEVVRAHASQFGSISKPEQLCKHFFAFLKENQTLFCTNFGALTGEKMTLPAAAGALALPFPLEATRQAFLGVFKEEFRKTPHSDEKEESLSTFLFSSVLKVFCRCTDPSPGDLRRAALY